MRVTVALDSELVRKAQNLTGIDENSALIEEALKALVQLTTSRRLMALGGPVPELKDIPRRRMN